MTPNLQSKYPVTMSDTMEHRTMDATPILQIVFKEYQNKYLMLQPLFKYNEFIVDFEQELKNVIFKSKQ